MQISNLFTMCQTLLKSNEQLHRRIEEASQSRHSSPPPSPVAATTEEVISLRVELDRLHRSLAREVGNHRREVLAAKEREVELGVLVDRLSRHSRKALQVERLRFAKRETEIKAELDNTLQQSTAKPVLGEATREDRLESDIENRVECGKLERRLRSALKAVRSQQEAELEQRVVADRFVIAGTLMKENSPTRLF